MATTIRDIAKQLNMSVSTVSYALNNGPRPVPAEVRDRVLKLAEELDYRPNRLAKSMVTGRTYTIGVVPSGQFENFVITPFILSCLNGIVNECERRKYDVLLFTRFDSAEEFEVANSISDGRADGVIFIAPMEGSQVVEVAHRRGIPFVVTNGNPSTANACLYVDNSSIVHMAIEHLKSKGHKQIGTIYGRQYLTDGLERKRQFEHLWKEGYFECRPEWIVDGDFTQPGGKQAALQILSQPDRPTALFCANDEMALGAIWACQELGIRVPQELSIIGVDNASWSPLITPGLTTIEQPSYDMAVEAVESLLSIIERCEPATSKQFRPNLVVRDTVDSPMEHQQS